MPTTARLGIPTPPLTGVTPDVPRDLLAMAVVLDKAVLFDQGTLASRPAPTMVGRTYYATDIGIEFKATGTKWFPVGIPLGGFVDYAGALAAPCPELLAANGAAISRATYADLYGIIGSTFGDGDGATTFNLPDTRDRVLVGTSGTIARAATLGEKTHVLTEAELAAHQHSVTNAAGSVGTLSVGVGAGAQQVVTAVVPFGNLATDFRGSGTGHNNMQPSLGINRLIRVL